MLKVIAKELIKRDWVADKQVAVKTQSIGG
jgi:hypothetical protein